MSAPDPAMASATDAAPRTGLELLLDSQAVPQDRYPMLEVVCERMVRSLASSIRALTGDTVDIALDRLTAVRFGAWLDERPLPAMLGVVRFEPWHGYGLIVVDEAMILALVDGLLGGDHAVGAPDLGERSFTAIEMRLVGKLMSMALDSFARAFAAIADISARVERIEVNPRFAAIASPSNAALALDFRVAMERHGGGFSLLLPQATIEPVRRDLMQSFMGEQDGSAAWWRAHLEHEIRRTHLSLDVLLGEAALPLARVRSLQCGDHIAFAHGGDAPLALRCNGARLADVQMGQRGGMLAASLLTALDTATDPSAAADPLSEAAKDPS